MRYISHILQIVYCIIMAGWSMDCAWLQRIDSAIQADTATTSSMIIDPQFALNQNTNTNTKTSTYMKTQIKMQTQIIAGFTLLDNTSRYKFNNTQDYTSVQEYNCTTVQAYKYTQVSNKQLQLSF